MADKQASPFHLRRTEKMSEEYVTKTYCPPVISDFFTDDQTIIIQGARGSGKSTILRNMVSLDGPDRLKTTTSGQKIIGSYVPFAKEWVSALQQNTQLRDGLSDSIFVHATNLYVAASVARSIERALHVLVSDEVERAKHAAKISKILAHQYTTESDPIPGVEMNLEETARRFDKMQRYIRGSYLRAAMGEEISFPEEWMVDAIFAPVKEFVYEVQEFEFFEDCVWMFAFDELDNLTIERQVIFNTIVRNAESSMVIKAACLPYGHRTLETTTPHNPIHAGDDFDYVALVMDPKEKRTQSFFEDLYRKRLKAWPTGTLPDDPKEWLGSEPLTDRFMEMYSYSKTETEWDAILEQEFRARKMSTDRDSRRKYRPVIAMRGMKERVRGNQKVPVYAGWYDVVAASDGNPRRFLALLDRLFESSDGKGKISGLKQSEVIREVAEGLYDKVASFGSIMQKMVDKLGYVFESRIHGSGYLYKDSCSVRISIAHQTEEGRDLLCTAVNYGILCAAPFLHKSGFPKSLHVFWLSYGLAPKFWLILRRGETLKVSDIGLLYSESSHPDQMILNFEAQD